MLAVLVLASGLLQANPAENAPSTHPLALQLSIPKDTYVAGEVIPLQVRFTSTATAPIVLSAQPEVGSGLQVLLTPPDAPEIPADFRRPSIGGIPMKTVIQPGGTLGADAALSPAYLKGRDFAPPKPGRWTLRATFQDMNGIVRSNVLVVNFVPADSLGKAAREILQSPSWHDFGAQ